MSHKFGRVFDKISDALISENAKSYCERGILFIALAGFVVHLSIYWSYILL